MQLVLSKNRIIAHGENFHAMGGVVINTETGARYENATIAECEGCPSDINEVGYEYHAGVFVPCAPYGKGNNNGYFMEVCETCATPRNSGLLIRDIKWSKVGSVTCSASSTSSNIEKSFTFPISESLLKEYSSLRYKIKSGSYLKFTVRGVEKISCGTEPLLTITGTANNYTTFTFDNDIILPVYMSNNSICDCNVSNQEITTNPNWCSPTGGFVDPLIITVAVGQYSSNKSEISLVIDLEGRK